jgi:pimeloyl-ACP methyl ester carboxylesterase
MADTTHRLIGALKLRRPDVVGWSMGGMTAQSLSVRHPRTIRRLVLLSSAPGDGRATPPTPAAGAVLTGDGLATTALTLLFPPAATAARDRFVRHLARRRNPQLTLPPDLTRAQVVASGAWLGGQDPDGKRVRGLRLPVLVGGGALDPLLPVANQRRLARIFLQRSRDFMPRLRRFLR